MKILVVEDERFDREVLIDVLEALGATVESATSYYGARSLLEREAYHAIVTDQYLGDGEGLQLQSFSGAAAVILLTGRGSETLAAEAISSGVVRYVPKSEDGQYVSNIGLTVAEAVLEQRNRLTQAARENTLRRQNIQLQRQVESMAITLRAPIEAARAASSGLMGLPQIQKDALSHRYVELIKQGTGRALQYLDSTRQFNLLKAEPAAPVALDAVVDQCQHQLASALADHRLAVHTEGLPQVLADASQLGILFHQLFKNVLRHTPAGTSVWIHTAAAAGGLTRVVFEDDGPGLEPSKRASAMSPFVTFDMSPERGPGLGLAIVQRIVALQGGTAELTQSEHGGLKVSFTLSPAV